MTRRMALAMQGRGPRWAQRSDGGATFPRGYLFEEMFAVRYDDATVDSSPPTRLSRLPPWTRLGFEIQRRSHEYDVVLSWSERVSLSLMAAQRLSPGGKPHIAMLYWFSRPSVRFPMRVLGSTLKAIITWSSVQREYAIEHLGVPPEKIYMIRHYADQVFWSSRERAEDMICGVGSEMRDYATLLDALRGTGIPCHIAADHVRVDRFGFARRVSTDDFATIAPPNVTIGKKKMVELRALYDRSRFVVVPLQKSDADNGTTVILEAMSMGKAVICSRTRGQVDIIQDGVTGIFVPVGDPAALRAAIVSLWNDPERARKMGAAARAYIEKHHALEGFVREVKAAIDAALDGPPAARDGSFRAPPRGDIAASV